jgi:DNA-binding transcriptional ArsR family regulator
MTPDQLSTTFAALADPTRRAILARLAEGDATVSELARPFDMSLPNVSKHLKVLKDAGLVTQGRDAQWRPCHLEPTHLRDASSWIEQYRQFWEDRFDRLDAYLRELQQDQQDQEDQRDDDQQP